MNDIKVINKTSFEYMKSIFPLAFIDLNYTNNLITYKNKSILLDNFNLQDFFDYNSYIIRDLSSEEVFNIIKVHVDTLMKVGPATKAKKETTILKPFNITGTGTNYNSPTELLTLDQFIMYVNKEEDYTEEDVKALNRFFDLVEDLILYEDFLIPKVKNILSTIQNIVLGLEIEA